MHQMKEQTESAETIPRLSKPTILSSFSSDGIFIVAVMQYTFIPRDGSGHFLELKLK